MKGPGDALALPLEDTARDVTVEGDGPPPPSGGAAQDLTADGISLGECIGRGAFGEVYRAFDRELRRPLAVKLLRVADASLRERLLGEAQAQARVNHRNVCKVFGMGLRDGDPFIAMQLVEGESLRHAADRLTLREKLDVMAQVCDGLAAAHEAGVIHRDIKPHNILVERHDGGWHAFIVDFGLAREPSGGAGHLAGTPGYMAPEQVEGGAVDARTDVWGVGATLFHLFAGKPPFAGASVAATLSAMLNGEPPSLRAVERSLPREVDWIVRRCLEKPPAGRYSSARAVAADLRRVLADEPVAVGPRSGLYRVRKLLGRHRLPLGLGALGVAVAAVLLSLLVRHRARAEELTHRAQTYARDVSRFELTMRQAYLRPAHDVTADEKPLRARLAEIARDLPLLDGESLEVARLALGKGYLAVGDPEAAQPYLQAAWDAGLRDPELEFALGEALAERYHRAVEHAARIEDRADRAAAESRAARQLRDPALPHLRAGSSAVESPPLVEAMVLADAGQLDDAERIARKLAVDEPWRFEAVRLVGDIGWTRALKLEAAGKDTLARATLAAAAASYGDALETAPSDPRARHRRCLVAEELAKLSYYARTLAQADIDRWRAWCADEPAAQAEVLTWDGQARIDSGERGADAVLREALRLAETAPPSYDSSAARADANFYLSRVSPVGPRTRAFLRETVAACRAAVALGARPPICFLGLMEYVERTDPPDGDALLAEMAREVDRQLAQDPGTRHYLHRFFVRAIRAERAAAHGLPADWRAAIDDSEKAAALSPEKVLGWHNAVWLARRWAAVEQRLGGDFGAAMATGRRDLPRALAIDPQDHDAHGEEAELDVIEARQAIADGGDPQPILRRADAVLDRLPRSLVSLADTRYRVTVTRYLAAPTVHMPLPAAGQHADAGAAWVAYVRVVAARHGDVAAAVAQALASIDRGCDEAPLETQGLAYRGLVLLEAARAAAAAERATKATVAVTELERALQVNPRLSHIIGDGLTEARGLAR